VPWNLGGIRLGGAVLYISVAALFRYSGGWQLVLRA
jgi:hypothetical protein